MATTSTGELLPFKKSDAPFLSGYKYKDPKCKEQLHQEHNGVDLSSSNKKAEIYSTTKGIVTKTYFDTHGGGNTAIVKSGDKEIKYMHLSGFNVKENQKIDTGQHIGTMGNTGGKSYGTHLHYEVRNGEKPQRPYEGNINGKRTY